MNRLTLGLLATFFAILLGSGLLAYVLRDRSAPPGVNAAAARSDNPLSSPGAAAPPETGTENQTKRGRHLCSGSSLGPTLRDFHLPVTPVGRPLPPELLCGFRWPPFWLHFW